MTASDAFSEYYAELLQGTYDCVDRIVLNAFFPVGQTAGGIRTWWRFLRGDDLSLDDDHLREMAGTFSRRLQAFCVKHGIPLIEAQARDRKHELAQPHVPNDPDFSGLFLVIKGNAPAPIWEVKRNGDGQIIEIRHRKSWPYVRHFYFHLIDREWGHVTIRICSYPPFGAQVILNGHERVERQARRTRVTVVKDGNCFIEGSDFSAISRLGAKFHHSDTTAQLHQLCERWIYSTCLGFALPDEDRKRSHFQYQYSVFQLELSRNVKRWMEMFNSSAGVVFCATLSWYGWRVVGTALALDEHSATDLGFPMWIYDAALPVGGFLMSMRYLIRLAWLLARADPNSSARSPSGHALPGLG